MASRAARSTWSAFAPLTIPLLDQPARQLRHPLDLVGDGAELLVEDDPVELLRLLLERHLDVLLPEEARIGEPRGEHPRIALRRSPRRRRSPRCWRRTRTPARAAASASVHAKYFWLVRMVSTITSRGTSRKSASNRPSSGTGHSVSPAFSTTSPSSGSKSAPPPPRLSPRPRGSASRARPGRRSRGRRAASRCNRPRRRW